MEESFDKASFLIYKHDFNSISHLSDELLGILFRTICEYHNDKNARLNIDPRIDQAFRFMKTRFDYDDKKYMKRVNACLLYTSPSPRDQRGSRMPSSA